MHDQVMIGFSFASDIDLEGGSSSLDQSQNTVKQNQYNPRLLSTLNRELLYLQHNIVFKLVIFIRLNYKQTNNRSMSHREVNYKHS